MKQKLKDELIFLTLALVVYPLLVLSKLISAKRPVIRGVIPGHEIIRAIRK